MNEAKVKTENLVEEQRFEIDAQAVALAESRAQNAQLMQQNAQMQGQISALMAWRRCKKSWQGKLRTNRL